MYKISLMFSLLFLGIFTPLAHASVVTATDFGACERVVDYGSTGFAQISGFYVVPPLGTERAADVEAATGLDFTCSVSGDGSGLMQLTYRLENTGGASTEPLKFIALVDPNGDDVNFTDAATATVVPGVNEADAYSVQDFLSGTINQDILIAGQLDSANTCGPFCDVVFGMQWDVGILSSGQFASIVIGLSDDGQRISDTFFTASRTLADGSLVNPVQTLTVSGAIAPIPVPPALLLLASGIASLLVCRRRQ